MLDFQKSVSSHFCLLSLSHFVCLLWMPSVLCVIILVSFRLHLYASLMHTAFWNTQSAASELFVCFCIVHGFEEEDPLENLHSVLFCLTEIIMKSVLFNLLCVFDFFIECCAGNVVFMPMSVGPVWFVKIGRVRDRTEQFYCQEYAAFAE